MKIYFKFIIVIICMLLYSGSLIKYDSNSLHYYSKVHNKTRLIQKVSKSVVRLTTLDSNGLEITTATGFAIKRKGNKTFILTNYHFCIETPDGDIYVEQISENVLAQKKSNLIVGKITMMNLNTDLCLLEVKKKIPILHLSHSYNQFDEVFTIGNPLGIFPIIVDTYISGNVKREDFVFEENRGPGNFILISQIVFPGHSGSPVFNKNGKVIGLIMASMSGYGTVAISSDTISSFLAYH